MNFNKKMKMKKNKKTMKWKKNNNNNKNYNKIKLLRNLMMNKIKMSILMINKQSHKEINQKNIRLTIIVTRLKKA